MVEAELCVQTFPASIVPLFCGKGCVHVCVRVHVCVYMCVYTCVCKGNGVLLRPVKSRW